MRVRQDEEDDARIGAIDPEPFEVQDVVGCDMCLQVEGHAVGCPESYVLGRPTVIGLAAPSDAADVVADVARRLTYARRAARAAAELRLEIAGIAAAPLLRPAPSPAPPAPPAPRWRATWRDDARAVLWGAVIALGCVVGWLALR